MRGPRTRLIIVVGNTLEILGAVSACVGTYLLAGLPWMLVLLAVLLIIAAELIYDASILRVPLPRRPQLRTRLLERRQALNLWRATRRVKRRKPLPSWPADDMAETLRPSPMVGELSGDSEHKR